MSISKDYLSKLCTLVDPVQTPLAFGPKLIPFNYIVNTQKAGTVFVMFCLMCYFNNYSLGAWIYLSLHGTYGIVWILKDIIFPDKSFQAKLTFLPSIFVIILLLSYWEIGFLMMSGQGDQNPSPSKIFICFFIFTIGLFLMVCTDLQKFIILSMKKGLIDNYFLSKNRNTNYLGEIMVYLSFAMITNKALGYFILIFVWVFIFGSRIYLKEQSLRKKDGYEKYKKNSYLILFKFTNSDYLNMLIYLGIVGLIFLYFKKF